ncbi:hypothetical protein ACWDPI_36105, partial [Streptomyces zhihengii]
MGRYVARRLLQMIPVFIGSTLLIFLMMYALPGDPVRALAGEQNVDQTQIPRPHPPNGTTRNGEPRRAGVR